ncbi:permease prefix domain 1-containing protein [Deinococcus yunweiensis]|uniref:permease prefix domain 1-containing protein n=1 Tax=Deinococcus yunweiensis TaxID=367282 RepID=UPI00398EEE24
MPRALTTYLRRATWGLPEARRQELWDELEEHVLTRADHLLLSGLSPTQAMAQAIRELGPPARVTLGMAKVYTMPKLLLAAGTLALGLSAGLYALAGGGGEVINLPVLTRPSPTTLCAPDGDMTLQFPVISRDNGQICYRIPDTTKGNGALVSIAAIKPAVEALGAELTALPNGELEIRMSDGQWSRGLPAYKAGGQSYMFASTLFGTLISLRQPSAMDSTMVSGYSNPVLRISGKTIKFDAVSDAQIGGNLYRDLAGEALNALFYPREEAHSFDTYYGSSTSPLHRIRTDLRAGEVVALIQRLEKNKFFADVGEIQADGTVSLRSSSTRITFVDRPAQAQAVQGQAPTAALLVRLSNIPLSNLKAGIFVPAQTTSDAR